MEIPNTCVKTVHKSPTWEAPNKIIQRTKEASREEALASTQQFLLLLTGEMLVFLLEVN